MGVPKFFRWLSERYPLINQRYHAPSNHIPESSSDSESDSDTYNNNDGALFGFSDSDSDGQEEEEEEENMLFSMKPTTTTTTTKAINAKKAIQQMSNEHDLLKSATLAPEIDRLYIDMNGIIHGCSHNNSDEDGIIGYNITNEEIFDNITTYLDRIIGDIVQPKQLVYMAIDGVAPRAKLNQQRSRRYRSNTGHEIEQTVYEAHMEALAKEHKLQAEAAQFEADFEEELVRRQQEMDLQFQDQDDPGAASRRLDDVATSILDGMDSSTSSDTAGGGGGGQLLTEVAPGRFSGKFETQLGTSSSMEDDDDLYGSDLDFHSNSITPGTPFFKECTDHLEAYIRDRLANDPKWKHLTIIFSGPNVPGEGEHKIMDFMRMQKQRPNYDPNLRHCIQGQDGDLIMLGLVTHEPNLVLFREQVIFDIRRRQAIEGIGVTSYVHNPNFEFLHMNVLRDYLAFDFETSNVVADSPFDLERTIDDFVFMTFFVGNDFLPAMPALDIADEAFDLLWYTYREHRQQWYEESKRTGVAPYLTDAGTIVSGDRLESFLSEVGSFESSYFDNKKEVEKETNSRIRQQDRRFGSKETIPDDDILEAKEAADRESFLEMMRKRKREAMKEREQGGGDGGEFDLVLTSQGAFQPSGGDDTNDDRITPGLSEHLGSLLRKSVATSTQSGGEDGDPDGGIVDIDDQDIKGRYYYDKFKFTPFDKEQHSALRKAYIEGLVWNLKYYYEGCASWSWYYPYHYGPMLSDLVGIDNMLKKVSFEGRLGQPLKPFEQLMACMPPSQAHVLPKPYRPLMTDADSSIIDFYPQKFTVDMNGKRWPWEAVVLLPFIDAERLVDSTRQITEEQLTEEERERNEIGEVMVLTNDSLAGEETMMGSFDDDSAAAVRVERFESTDWQGEIAGFQPSLKSGTQVPLPGLPTLRSAPIRSMWRRHFGLNVFGMPSRYKTACLEHSESMPVLPPLQTLGPTLIGTTVWINFPHLTEAFVTAISNEKHSIRGTGGKLEAWSVKDKLDWAVRRDRVVDAYERGQGFTGTGGLIISPDQDILLSVRPLKGLRDMPDGAKVKTFAKEEIDVPIVATLWAPLEADPRLSNVPALVEKNPYKFHLSDSKSKEERREGSKEKDDSSQKKVSNKSKEIKKVSKKSKEIKESKSAKRKVSPSEPVELESEKETVSSSEPVELDMFARVDESLITATRDPEAEKRLQDMHSTGKGSNSGFILPLVPPAPVSETATSPTARKKSSLVAKAKAKAPRKDILPLLNGINGSAKIRNKRNGEMEAPKRRNGEVQAPKKLTPKPRKEAKNLHLFPLKPSHEDVWRPIPEESFEDLALFPLTPSHEDVWRPIEDDERSSEDLEDRALFLLTPGQEDVRRHTEGESDSSVLDEAANVLPRLASTKLKVSAAEEEGSQLVKATNQRWWEVATYKKGSTPSRRFSTWSQANNNMRKALHRPPPRTQRQYSTSASRQKIVGKGRGRVLAAGVAAATLFFGAGGTDASQFGILSGRRRSVGSVAKTLVETDWIRGGSHSWSLSDNANFDDNGNDEEGDSKVPPLEFAHGTTTLSFVFQGGAIVAVDSRASMGSFVGSKTTQKVLPINSHMLGTMAGGAADCSHLIREMRSIAMLFELEEGRRISTARVSNILARFLYGSRGAGLSVGTMIVGYDDLPIDNENNSPQIYYVDDSGTRLKGKMFSAGSGSTFALGILDTEYRYDLTEDDAVALGIKAIRYATLRDAFSGGFINVYVVTKEGWKKVFTEDVAVVKPVSDETMLENDLN